MGAVGKLRIISKTVSASASGIVSAHTFSSSDCVTCCREHARSCVILHVKPRKAVRHMNGG